MKKYPKIKRIGHRDNDGILESGTLVVQEKMDGANFRFTWEPNEGIVFGSRRVVWKNEKDIDKNFRHAVEYVRENVHQGALAVFSDRYAHEVTFFGEAMHPHTLDYDWDSVPSFLGFDIYAEGEWLPYEEIEYAFGQMDLPVAPLLYHGPARSFPENPGVLEGTEIPESHYRDGVPEGIVIKNEDTGQRAKVRTPQFKEAHGTPNPEKDTEYEPSDAVALAHQFTTEARVQKMVHKMEDEGHDAGMEMMEDLWRRVFEDIIEEEYDTIFLGNHVLDTKEFRSKVANLTAEYLQRYLSRPSGSVLNQEAV